MHKTAVCFNLLNSALWNWHWHQLTSFWQCDGADIETSMSVLKLWQWQTRNLCNYVIYKYMRCVILVFFKFLVGKTWMQKFAWTGRSLQLSGFLRLCSTCAQPVLNLLPGKPDNVQNCHCSLWHAQKHI